MGSLLEKINAPSNGVKMNMNSLFLLPLATLLAFAAPAAADQPELVTIEVPAATLTEEQLALEEQVKKAAETTAETSESCDAGVYQYQDVESEISDGTFTDDSLFSEEFPEEIL